MDNSLIICGDYVILVIAGSIALYGLYPYVTSTSHESHTVNKRNIIGKVQEMHPKAKSLKGVWMCHFDNTVVLWSFLLLNKIGDS